MNLGENIRKGAKWLAAGSLGGQLVQFAVGIVLARLLVPADFGAIVTIQIFTGLAGYLVSGGTGEALIQAKEVEARHYDVVFTLQLVMGSLIYLFFFLIAPWFAAWFDSGLYQDLLRVSALSFLLRPFANLPRVKLRREMRFRPISLIDFSVLLWISAISISLAYGGFGPWSLVLGALIGTSTTAVLLMSVARWRPAFRFDREVAMRLGGYGLKVSATELVGYLSTQTANLIVSRLMGPAIVGLYNKGDSLSQLPLRTISGAVYQPVFRALAQVQDDKNQSRYIYLRTITLLIVYTLPIYIGLAWLARPFIEVVYGPKWLSAAEPLQILSTAGLLFCIWHPAGAVVAAQNQLGRELVVNLISWAALAAGCIVGAQFGIAGVAWAVLATHIYTTSHMTWLASRCIGIRFSALVAAVAPASVPSLILLATLALLDAMLPANFAATHAAVYMVLLSGAGALAYAGAFLFLPLPLLASESARWRRALRLARE